MKKLLRIITVILMITTMFTQIAFAEETNNTIQFSDLDETYWAYESVQKLVEAGIIEGYDDGTFKPDGDITRAELVKITNLVFAYTQKLDSSLFTDVNSEDWFYNDVLIAQNAGYIVGYTDGTFKPNDLITRQELCKILDSINNFVVLPYNDTIVDEVSTWAVEYVNKVVSNRIMTLDENNKFRATEKATRAEACDALAKFIISEEPVTETPTPIGGGSTGTADEELYKTMDTVIRRLEKGVIPNLTTDAQKEIVEDIISNMNEYKADDSHDYEDAADDVYEKYKDLSEEEQDNLKYQIQIQNSTKDLLKLKDFFFPNADL